MKSREWLAAMVLGVAGWVFAGVAAAQATTENGDPSLAAVDAGWEPAPAVGAVSAAEVAKIEAGAAAGDAAAEWKLGAMYGSAAWG